MSFFSKITGGITDAISNLKNLVSTIAGQVGQIFDVFVNIRDYTIGAFEEGTALVEEVETEYDAIINFKFAPHWKDRVIQPVKVFDNISELAKLPQRVIQAVKDLITRFRTRFQATELVEAGEEFLPVLGQILGVATLIAEILLAIRDTLSDLKTIVDAIKTVREDLENLDLLFLPQHNPRRIEKLADGSTIKIRVGSLHKT